MFVFRPCLGNYFSGLRYPFSAINIFCALSPGVYFFLPLAISFLPFAISCLPLNVFVAALGIFSALRYFVFALRPGGKYW